MSLNKSNKQIAIILETSPTIKPKALAKRRLLPKNNYNQKLNIPICDSKKNLKTIKIKTEESHPESLTTTKILTSEASTYMSAKPFKIINQTINRKSKGYIFKNHRSIQKNNRKEQEVNDLKEFDLFNYKSLFTDNNKTNNEVRSVSRAKLANSFYYVLGKQNIDRVEQIKNKISQSNTYYSSVKQRKQCAKLNLISPLLSHDTKEKPIPFGDPLPLINDHRFENESELHRFQKISNSLLNLRYKINNNPELEIPLLKEFIFNNGIYKTECFSIKSLNKLSSFIKSNFTINPKKSLKMVLIELIDSSRSENKATNTAVFKSLIRYKRGKSANNIKKSKINQDHDIRLNMSLQKSLYENKVLRTDIDLINNPETTIEELKKEINRCYSNIPFKKSAHQTFLNGYNNMRNTDYKFQQSSSKDDYQIDINEIKKQNKLLEYICYEKAMNNLQVNKCNKKVPFLQTMKL